MMLFARKTARKNVIYVHFKGTPNVRQRNNDEKFPIRRTMRMNGFKGGR
jgi:hypothetical protein